MIAAFYGHLTVLRTLVEQYGGNVLNRLKVIKVFYDERYRIVFVCGKSLIIPSIENIEQQKCQWYRS